MKTVIRLKSAKAATVNTPTGVVRRFQTLCLVTSMAHKTLKDQLRFTYQFYLLMNAVGRDEEAKLHLVKLDAIINGINPALKAVKLDNLKQQAK